MPPSPAPRAPLIATLTGGDDAASAIQAGALARARPIGLMLNIFAVLLTILPLWGQAPAVPLAMWGATMALLSIAGWLDDRRARAGGRPDLPARMSRAALDAALIGLLWSAPLVFFGRWCDQATMMLLAAATPLLMVASAASLAAAPRAALLFLAPVTIGGTVAMLRVAPAALPLPAMLAAILAWAVLHHARALVGRRGVEIALAEREAVVSLLLHEFQDAADWLWQVDAARTLVAVDPPLAQRLGRAADTLAGRPLIETLAGPAWQGGDLPRGLHELAEKLRLRESFGNLVLPVPIGGETRWWSLSAVPRHDDAGRFLGHRGVGSDVTDQRRAAEQVDRMARCDALTGLANRRQVMEALGQALVAGHRDGRRTAFLIIDLDRFKQINDTLGHPVGDRLLREVSARLLALCGTEALCGRLGGDEFAVVIADPADMARVDRLADDIIAVLSAPYEFDEHRLFIGASIGSAAAPRDGRSVETLVRFADLALYRAKDDGRGVHRRYEQQLAARAEERREIEIALRDALDRDQFRLVYQPIVTAAQGQVIGFEALLRWTHPTLGEVSPERFVPIAEEARLMGRIGGWVIHTACREAAGWPVPSRIAINLTADQLHDAALLPTLRTALADSGLPPQRLELEVAESVFLNPGVGTARILDHIHAIGIRVALSDFGTGYASLGYLRGARFSTIKIDRSFVVGACADAPDSLAIIRAVVAMADSLGMAVTAEGAETEREYAVVRRLGCNQVQGYYFGHPVPPEAARLLAGVPAERKVA